MSNIDPFVVEVIEVKTIVRPNETTNIVTVISPPVIRISSSGIQGAPGAAGATGAQGIQGVAGTLAQDLTTISYFGGL